MGERVRGREGGEGNARRRRSVSRICVSTSLMPTPGPPLREREGITRRGREVVAWDPSPGFEAEAEAACDRDTGSGLEEGPAAAGPSSAVIDLEATMVVVVVVDEDDAMAAAAAAVAGGRAVDAETRLGMRLGDSEEKDFLGGRGRVGERGGIEGGRWMGWASSPVRGVSALARYGTCEVSRLSHLFNSISRSLIVLRLAGQKISSCKVRSCTRTVVVRFLLYMGIFTITTTTIALIPLSIPAAFIHRRCRCLVLAIREILLPRLLLHHLQVQAKLRCKPRIDVRLYGMLLRGHELLLLLRGRIRLCKAELWRNLRGKWCILRCAIILPSYRRHHGRGWQWSRRTERRAMVFCPMW